MKRLLDCVMPLGRWTRGSGYPFRLDMDVWLWSDRDGELIECYLDSMFYIFESMEDRYYPNALSGRPT